MQRLGAPRSSAALITAINPNARNDRSCNGPHFIVRPDKSKRACHAVFIPKIVIISDLPRI